MAIDLPTVRRANSQSVRGVDLLDGVDAAGNAYGDRPDAALGAPSLASRVDHYPAEARDAVSAQVGERVIASVPAGALSGRCAAAPRRRPNWTVCSILDAVVAGSGGGRFNRFDLGGWEAAGL